MLKKQKKLSLNFRILKLLIFSPILISIPFFTSIYDAKAGLEFQWDQDSGYRRLKWYQTESQGRFRNRIYFFFRRVDRKRDLLKITLSVPKTFKTKLENKKISFCKVNIGGFESRTKCLEQISADIDIKEDNSSIDIYPYKPIPSDKDNYAIVVKTLNPRRSGLYQFHSYGQYAGAEDSSYLGSWTIVID